MRLINGFFSGSFAVVDITQAVRFVEGGFIEFFCFVLFGWWLFFNWLKSCSPYPFQVSRSSDSNSNSKTQLWHFDLLQRVNYSQILCWDSSTSYF